MKLKACIHEFFAVYLPRIKGSSTHTAQSYRDTFKLLVPFAATWLAVPAKQIELEHLSFDLVLAFLNHLHEERGNTARTINSRLATLKSLAKMIRLLHPDYDQIAETILRIPQRRYHKRLIGFLTPDEILTVMQSVDLRKKEGVRDYCLLHLLFDSGARASEVAELKLDAFDANQRTLAILGKGSHYRLIALWPKTADLMNLYLKNYRQTPKLLYRDFLFINQRGEPLTRHGIYSLCKNYLVACFPAKRLKQLSPAHSFRHSCAMHMLLSGESLTTIKNHLGHENLQSTMVYVKLTLRRKQSVQNRFLNYTQARLSLDPKIDALIDWEHKAEVLTWLDSL